MVEILNNPIVSGVIVFLLTLPFSILVTRFGTKTKYKKEVKDANKEAVELVMNYILTLEKMENFNKSTVSQIIRAVSLKNEVDLSDMHKLSDIYSLVIIKCIELRIFPEELRREIFIVLNKQDEVMKIEEETIKLDHSEQKDNFYTFVFFTVILSGILTFFIFLQYIYTRPTSSDGFYSYDFSSSLSGMVFILVASLMSIILLLNIYKDKKKIEDLKKHKKENDMDKE